METSGCDALPDQHWVPILSLLSARDLLRASFVSHRFKSLALQVPNVNNTSHFYKKVPPQPSNSHSSSPARRRLRGSIELKALLEWLPGLVKNALILRMDGSARNKCAGCLEAMTEAGELPTSLGTLEWEGVRVADLPSMAQLLQKNLNDIRTAEVWAQEELCHRVKLDEFCRLWIIWFRPQVFTLGAFIAAAASACTALEILRLRLEREQIPGLEKSPSDCDSDDDRCEGSDVSDCDEDGTAFEYSPAEVFYMDESAVLLGPNAATLDPLQVQDVPVVPLGGGNGGTLHSEENGDGDFPGKGSDTTDFGSSVRQLLHKCWALRKLQLPYAMLAHFEGAWRHAGLQSLTLHELVDVAHCTDTINAMTCHFPALRHLALSSCASGSNSSPLESRVCESKTLETVKMYGFIYPRSCSFDMPRLTRLVLGRAHRLSLSPIEDEVSDMDGPAVLVGQLESDKEEQRVAWKRSQASYLQLFCPALEELTLSFPITGAALSEAGATLPALRTLDLEALSAPDLILSGGFPALVSTRLGFYSTAAHFCTIEHRTVRAVTAFFGPLTEPLDGRKHLAISCAALEVLIVREVHRWRGDVRFASAIWAPNLRKIELPKEADVTSALWAAADVEELVIHVHSSEDLKPLSSLKKLRALRAMCVKGCKALVLESASLAELDVIIMSAHFARVHVIIPRLGRLKFKNVLEMPLHVTQLRLALGHVTKLRLPFAVTSLQFGAECPRLEKLHLPAYLGTAVHVDRATFPALKSLELVIPKAKLRSIDVRSEALQRFKLHAVRPQATPGVCIVCCPQLKELHLHVLPPSLRAIGAGCPSLETLVVAGGLHMELRAHDNSLAEKTASPAAGNLPGMKETLVGGTGLVLGKWYPNEGLDDSGNGGGVRGADEVPPALTGLVKGKEKIEEGGLNETRGEKGGKKRGSEGKQEGARQPVVKGYSIELGEDFQSLREAHIQVWTAAQPSKKFQHHFGFNAGRDHWCIAASAYAEAPKMRGLREEGNECALRYLNDDPEETEEEAASGQASPEAANAIPPDGRGTQRTSATSTKASTTLGPSNTSVGERGASIHEEPFLSRLTSKVPSRGRLPKQSSRLTSLGPVLNLDVTCPRLRELQVFTDLRLVSATVVSAEMRCLRAWVVSDGGGRV